MTLSMMLKRLFEMGFTPAGLAFKTGIPEEMLIRIAESGEVNLAEFGKEIGSEKLSRLSVLLGQMLPFEEKYPRISREKAPAERKNTSQTIEI